MSPTVAVISGAGVIAAAVLTGLFGLVLWWLNRKKTDADTDLSDASAEAKRAEAWGLLTTQQSEWSKFVASELQPIREELKTVRSDVRVLKGERDHEREQRRLSNEYVRTLAAALEPFAEVPSPPPDLDLD